MRTEPPQRRLLDFRLVSQAVKAAKYSGFVPVKNEDFRKWQDKNMSGGDFFVSSDVKWVDSNVDHIAL